jgi:hypothetical protein
MANIVSHQQEVPVRTIQAVTDIDAPIETVWAELAAVSAYPAWNPFITRFDGDLVVGGRVAVRIAPPGGRPMTFRPTITVVEEAQRLEWLGRLLVPGIFDGRHSFRLEARADGRTRLTQAEQFGGVLVPLAPSTLEKTRAGFEAMNQALRLRAEAAAEAVR